MGTAEELGFLSTDDVRAVEKLRAQKSIEVKPISRNLILQRMQQVIAAAVLSGCDVDPHDEPFVALMAFMREWGWIK